MKIFFIGDHFNAGGPNEVNKNLLSVLHGFVRYEQNENKLIKRIERFFKILFSKYIVCSGIFIKGYELKLIKILGKKLIYIMHGCYYLETGKRHKIEDGLLHQSDLILCVSKSYRDFISSHMYPQYSYKMEVLTNAINWNEYNAIESNNINRDRNKIILIGGGRILKRNLQVCKAVQNINNQKCKNYHIDVYGYYRDNDDSKEISEIPCVSFHNVIPHNLLLKEFQKSVLFVQNSDFESFSLGVVEAIICGCNALISKNVGAKDVLESLKETDIINNTNDIDEIQKKIEFVLEHNNNKRLLDSINKETTSIQYSANKLISYIVNLEK